MTERNAKTGSAAANPLVGINANVLTAAMILGAGLLAFIGAMLPDWVGLPGPETRWLSYAFYVLAAGEVLLAFYLRAMIRKAQKSAAKGGGTIERQ
jgi:hypothetical protein